MSRRTRWGAAAAAVTALILLSGTASAATGWTVVSVPKTTGTNVELNAAFARTNTDAWAVGVQFGPAGQTPPPVAYHWNGTAWSMTATPSLGLNASLTGVSASSGSDAWAVGFIVNSGHVRTTLLEHWNGSAWSQDTADEIQGYQDRLAGVVDLGPGNAWAVGTAGGGALLEHWNGSAWSVVATPGPAGGQATGLTSITAVSATDIWAVGSYLTTTFTNGVYALHYNGSTWMAVPMPQPAQNTPVLNGVTAVSAGDVWAVGETQGVPGQGLATLTEHWNGSAWSIMPSPTPGAYPALNAVAARGSGDVYAAGFNMPSINGGVQQGLILRWNGSSWSQDTDPTTGTFSPLYGAATFPGASREWAVGINSAGQALVLSHG